MALKDWKQLKTYHSKNGRWKVWKNYKNGKILAIIAEVFTKNYGGFQGLFIKLYNNEKDFKLDSNEIIDLQFSNVNYIYDKNYDKILSIAKEYMRTH